MIEIPTVFILGAGASKPYGYPTGQELRSKICRNIVESLENLIMKIDDAEIRRYRANLITITKEFAPTFYKSDTKSIDIFLARNRKYYDVGTFAIALNILVAEQHSHFREEVPVKENWYTHLNRRMRSEMPKEDDYEFFGKNKVSFITFNYDRSLEFYLYDSLINAFTSIPLTNIQVRTLMPFEIIHVFGKIADLPWESKSGLEYASGYDFHKIDKAKDNIKIIFETPEVNFLKKIKREIANAKRVFFLGFGFAKENLKILGIPEVLNNEQEIYGTALGFTNKEILQIRRTLSKNFEPWRPEHDNPVIENLNCYNLLREYL